MSENRRGKNVLTFSRMLQLVSSSRVLGKRSNLVMALIELGPPERDVGICPEQFLADTLNLLLSGCIGRKIDVPTKIFDIPASCKHAYGLV